MITSGNAGPTGKANTLNLSFNKKVEWRGGVVSLIFQNDLGGLCFFASQKFPKANKEFDKPLEAQLLLAVHLLSFYNFSSDILCHKRC